MEWGQTVDSFCSEESLIVNANIYKKSEISLVTSRHVVSRHVVSRHVAWRHVTLFLVTFLYVTTRHIPSSQIMLRIVT